MQGLPSFIYLFIFSFFIVRSTLVRFISFHSFIPVYIPVPIPLPSPRTYGLLLKKFSLSSFALDHQSLIPIPIFIHFILIPHTYTPTTPTWISFIYFPPSQSYPSDFLFLNIHPFFFPESVFALPFFLFVNYS